MPDDGEVAGLLALMLLTEARRAARVSAGGELVALDEQDRGAWDSALIAEGHRLVRERLAAAAAGVAPGRYQILAAINAVHTFARDVRDTDWSQVLALDDQFVRLSPSRHACRPLPRLASVRHHAPVPRPRGATHERNAASPSPWSHAHPHLAS
jgi:predicted RNA polymerase sigma factor